MGLPEFILNFNEKAKTATKRAERGIVAVILADSTKTDTGDAKYSAYNYTSENDIVSSHWTAENLGYLKQIFLRSPKRVLVQRITPPEIGSDATYKTALEILKHKMWNYLVIPGINIEASDSENISSVKDVCNWIKTMRSDKKRFKAVLPCTAAGVAADYEGIIDFATENITVGAKTYTAAQYCPRIAGILATVPLSESGTYEILSEISSITESSTPDNDIDSGKLILINDGEEFKIGRAVNSLTTITGTGKTEDWKKIKIVDAMDFIFDDIKTVFETNYMGTANSYDNKQLFVAAVNDYLEDLASQEILDPEGNNTVAVDIEKQREWLTTQGKNTVDMTDDEIKKAKTGSYIFVSGTLSFLDAIEDLEFSLYM